MWQRQSRVFLEARPAAYLRSLPLRAAWRFLFPLVLFLVVVTADPLLACPTCKDGLAYDDPGLSGVAQGFSYSILLMMSMPFLIFGGLASYFYFEVRRARKRLATGKAVSAMP